MPVIFHQTIRQQSSPRASHCFREHRLKRNEVLILRKDRHPRIRPVQHMINPTTRSCSLWSSRVENPNRIHRSVNEKSLTHFCDSRAPTLLNYHDYFFPVRSTCTFPPCAFPVAPVLFQFGVFHYLTHLRAFVTLQPD